jgi:orotate phosphoribosyltransferase
MTQDEVLNIFRETGALLEGHFVLTSGFHSPHYFQCAKVLQYPEYLSVFSGIIARYFEDNEIDVVISPAVGGIVLGTEIGRILNVRTVFAERENGKLTLRRGFELKKSENVLAVEDVVTTGGSVFELIEIVKQQEAVLSGVGFIIDRSNGKVNFGCKQISLAKFDVVKFAENEIPEWLGKIPVYKPGSRLAGNKI